MKKCQTGMVHWFVWHSWTSHIQNNKQALICKDLWPLKNVQCLFRFRLNNYFQFQCSDELRFQRVIDPYQQLNLLQSSVWSCRSEAWVRPCSIIQLRRLELGFLASRGSAPRFIYVIDDAVCRFTLSFFLCVTKLLDISGTAAFSSAAWLKLASPPEVWDESSSTLLIYE